MRIPFFLLLVFLAVPEAFGQKFDWSEKVNRRWVSVAAGPSFMYATTGGNFSNAQVALQPAFSLGLEQELNRHFSVQATTGVQFLSSLPFSAQSETRLANWAEAETAFQMSGQALFIDVAPRAYLFSRSPFYGGNRFNVYAAAGVGGMVVNRLVQIQQGETPAENTLQRRETSVHMYFPVRTGAYFRLSEKDRIGVEGSLFISLSDALDGNTSANRFQNMLGQFQIVYKRQLFID
ncbi:hypothetical protein A3SI_04287 [Nitritalea halalkaliphila LW7]|uniref:Outer membrane protein beta-barrel domain-containing protein n=1 Tax=Nitritalea halalkaliphila LW7 TaxID=1189621 RepID=I5C930_9BACT|nr:hypothetical protein [Nitritalea halalkaliphila]EIM78332.1 hypothetical protein A3SI_04287 [Nitritalea halalkaliphila LW7]